MHHNKPGIFLRILRKIPGWLWWSAGSLVVALYACFFYYFFVSPFGFRWKALYGDASYPDEYEIHGIDISHYQGNIDWDKLRNHGFIGNHPVRFIMIKATEGSTKLDDKFLGFAKPCIEGYIRNAILRKGSLVHIPMNHMEDKDIDTNLIKTKLKQEFPLTGVWNSTEWEILRLFVKNFVYNLAKMM